MVPTVSTEVVHSRILLVDDSRVVRDVIKVQLMGSGIEFIEATDGDQALRLLRHETVDLIISDIQMPTMDGLTFVKRVRHHTRGEIRDVPIIRLTASKSPDQHAREGLAAGASAFLQKPVASANLHE